MKLHCLLYSPAHFAGRPPSEHDRAISVRNRKDGSLRSGNAVQGGPRTRPPAGSKRLDMQKKILTQRIGSVKHAQDKDWAFKERLNTKPPTEASNPFLDSYILSWPLYLPMICPAFSLFCHENLVALAVPIPNLKSFLLPVPGSVPLPHVRARPPDRRGGLQDVPVRPRDHHQVRGQGRGDGQGIQHQGPHHHRNAGEGRWSLN